MQKSVVILVAALLQSMVTFGATFRYAGTVVSKDTLYFGAATKGDTLVENAYKNTKIELSDPSPRSLRIFGESFRMDAPFSSIRTGPESWEEHYLVETIRPMLWPGAAAYGSRGWHGGPGGHANPGDSGSPGGRSTGHGHSWFSHTSDSASGEFLMVTLCKSLSEGVGEIRIDKSGNTYLFRPAAGERVAVTGMPPVFINLVEIANVKPDGTIIDDYGSAINPDEIGCLKIRMICQTAAPGGAVALNIAVAEPFFTFFVDRTSRRGLSYSLPATPPAPADSAGMVGYEIGLWSPRRLPAGCRLEISAGGQTLCSAAVPLPGTAMCQPYAVAEVGRFVPDWTLAPAAPLRFPLGTRSVYSRPRASLYFQAGDKIFRMTKWLTVEIPQNQMP